MNGIPSMTGFVGLLFPGLNAAMLALTWNVGIGAVPSDRHGKDMHMVG